MCKLNQQPSNCLTTSQAKILLILTGIEIEWVSVAEEKRTRDQGKRAVEVAMAAVAVVQGGALVCDGDARADRVMRPLPRSVGWGTLRHVSNQCLA
jgi:hypothetical protein